MIEAILSVLAAIGGAAGSVKFVREGERGIMLRFEKAVKRHGEYRVILPGLRIMVPGVHKLARIHVRQRTINFPEQAIVLSDSTIFAVGAVLMCRVKDTAQDLYNALFETTGIDDALTDYGLLVVREVLAGKRYEDLFGPDRMAISRELRAAALDQAAEWGVDILSFELSDCRPNAETARLIQTAAQATFKLDALTVAAQRLGVADVSLLDPGLASVLIGAPLVASTSVTVADSERQPRPSGAGSDGEEGVEGS